VKEALARPLVGRATGQARVEDPGPTAPQSANRVSEELSS
jgi:hypothetical protein